MRTILIPLLAAGALTACSGTDAQNLELNATAQAALPQTFTFTSGEAVYSPGDLVEFAVTGAPANAFLAVFWTDNGPGVGPCPPLLQGGCVDILPGTNAGGIFYLPQADGTGSSFLSATAPLSLDFGDLTFQVAAYDPATGAITGSAPYTLTIAPPGSPDCAPDDAFESNDGVADGAAIAPSGTTGLIVCDEDPADYYAVDMLAGDVLDASIAFADGEGDLDLFVVDTIIDIDAWGTINTASLAGGTSVDDNEFFSWTAPADGTYYLVAYQFADDGVSPGNTYDLTYEIGAPDPDCAVDDAFEPNDDALGAPGLAVGATTGLVVCDDDVNDYFTFGVLAGETVDFAVTWDTITDPDDDADFYIDAPTAGQMASGTELAGITESGSFTVTEDGTHTIQVEQWDGGADGTITYDAELTITTPTNCPVDEASEENEDQAAVQAAGQTVTFPSTGYLCLFDGDDFYAVDVLAGETITVDLTHANPADDLDLYLFDAAGVQVDGSAAVSPADEQVTWTATADGTITFVATLWELDAAAGPGTGEYTVDVTITPPVP